MWDNNLQIANSASLFSIFMHGAGVTDFTSFYERINDTLKDVLHDINVDLIFRKIIVPGMREIRLAKAQDRRVIGCMNENVAFAKILVEEEGLGPYEMSMRMSKFIHLCLGAKYPVDAFLGMRGK